MTYVVEIEDRDGYRPRRNPKLAHRMSWSTW